MDEEKIHELAQHLVKHQDDFLWEDRYGELGETVGLDYVDLIRVIRRFFTEDKVIIIRSRV